MASKRLMKELSQMEAQMEKGEVDWATAEPEGDDAFTWNCSVIGPAESPYEGGVFNLVMKFPPNYPF